MHPQDTTGRPGPVLHHLDRWVNAPPAPPSTMHVAQLAASFHARLSRASRPIQARAPQPIAWPPLTPASIAGMLAIPLPLRPVRVIPVRVLPRRILAP